MVEHIGTGLISCPVDFAVRSALLSSKAGATIRSVTSPLEHLKLLIESENPD